MPRKAHSKPSIQDTADKSAFSFGFRMDAASQREMFARADALNCSVHQLAKDYVFQVLTAPQKLDELHVKADALTEQMSQLLAFCVTTTEQVITLNKLVAQMKANVFELRGDVALAVEALLVSAGKVEPEMAQKYIKANFRT